MRRWISASFAAALTAGCTYAIIWQVLNAAHILSKFVMAPGIFGVIGLFWFLEEIGLWKSRE